MHVHACIFFFLIGFASVKSQTCSCYCGSYTYYPGTTCSTSSSCANTCYYSYAYCYSSNTRGCCGSQTCAYYSSSSYYYYYNQCNCKCSSSSSSSTVLLGSASMSNCNSTLCAEACNSLYPTTCGVYSNQAYCSYNSSYQQSASYLAVFIMLIVCLIQNMNKFS